jgi:alpha-beta hydrolase superfamily lysophospholipase/SAM-dependent methyltransferase
MMDRPVERRLVLSDGTELFYRAWLPDARPRAALVLLHRGHEHSGRFADLVQALGLTDTAVFAWDARGHGRSPGDRGYAPSFARIVRDLDEFVRHVCRTHGLAIEDVVALGHSVGAVAVAAWVHDHAPRVRAMVLVTPALRVRLYVPLAVPGLRLLRALRGQRRTFVKSYVRARMLTHDVAEAQAYDADPLIARTIAVNVLLDLHDTATRLIDDAAAIRTPTLILSAASDWVVTGAAQARFFERLGASDKRMRVFPGMYHDVLHEADRHLAIDEIRRFILAAGSRPDRPAPLLDADQHGYTRDEYDRLAGPPDGLAPRTVGFALLKSAMQSLGRLSAGIRLGWRTGFDSGQSLDYVYQDRAHGALGIGRWLDRIYLDSPGWRGVRQRRANLQSLLIETIGRLTGRGVPVRLVDIASGPGRYVLEAVVGQSTPVSVLLRDRDPANLDAARDVAKRLGLTDVTVEVADAFDAASLAAITPPPDIAIVSGLYELIPDNARVRASLHGLAKALGGGGYLLYTGQPWHPQLELIARVLRNRDGRSWVMRRRTQEELDDLVRAAGFEKVETRTDDAGIFTVSVARIGGVGA